MGKEVLESRGNQVSGSLQFLASAGAHKNKENTCHLSVPSVSDLILCKLISRLNKPNIWYSQDGPGCIIPNFMYEETETLTCTIACVGAESGFWTKAVWCEWDSVLWDDCLVTEWLNYTGFIEMGRLLLSEFGINLWIGSWTQWKKRSDQAPEFITLVLRMQCSLLVLLMCFPHQDEVYP